MVSSAANPRRLCAKADGQILDLGFLKCIDSDCCRGGCLTALEVRSGRLVEGPVDVYICSECVSLCQSIIDQEKRRRNITSAGSAALDSGGGFPYSWPSSLRYFAYKYAMRASQD
jgi:hypothetical protein